MTPEVSPDHERFRLLWINHEPLYSAILTYASECLTRLPTMTPQTLGANVKLALRSWSAQGEVNSVLWGGGEHEVTYGMGNSATCTCRWKCAGNPHGDDTDREVDAHLAETDPRQRFLVADWAWDELTKIDLGRVNEEALAEEIKAELDDEIQLPTDMPPAFLRLADVGDIEWPQEVWPPPEYLIAVPHDDAGIFVIPFNSATQIYARTVVSSLSADDVAPGNHTTRGAKYARIEVTDLADRVREATQAGTAPE